MMFYTFIIHQNCTLLNSELPDNMNDNSNVIYHELFFDYICNEENMPIGIKVYFFNITDMVFIDYMYDKHLIASKDSNFSVQFHFVGSDERYNMNTQAWDLWVLKDFDAHEFYVLFGTSFLNPAQTQWLDDHVADAGQIK